MMTAPMTVDPLVGVISEDIMSKSCSRERCRGLTGGLQVVPEVERRDTSLFLKSS